MKYFIDGDQLVIVSDNFINLQESRAVFFPLKDKLARSVLQEKTVMALPVGELFRVMDILKPGWHPQVSGMMK